MITKRKSFPGDALQLLLFPSRNCVKKKEVCKGLRKRKKCFLKDFYTPSYPFEGCLGFLTNLLHRESLLLANIDYLYSISRSNVNSKVFSSLVLTNQVEDFRGTNVY